MKKVVLTGGPCAGKTKILNMLQAKYMDKVVFVPEAATIIFDKGYPRDGDDPSYEWLVKFQGVVVERQIKQENEALITAQETGASVIVCDRGVLDGIAYIGRGREVFCDLYDLDFQKILSSYDKVMHLESRAIGDPAAYGNNSNHHRKEGVEAARAIDKAIWDSWDGHPDHVYIPFTGEIEEKASKVDEEICESL
jgi:predicted ATPase